MNPVQTGNVSDAKELIKSIQRVIQSYQYHRLNIHLVPLLPVDIRWESLSMLHLMTPRSKI